MLTDKIHSSEYKAIWDILNALMEQDSDLSDVVRKLYSGKFTSSSERTRSIYDPLFKFMGINASVNLQNLINVRIIDKMVSPWDRSYAMLCEYKELHGTAEILKEHPNDDLKRWCTTQRCNELSMPDYRKQQLNNIGFRWYNHGSTRKRWEDLYQELVIFKKLNGRNPSDTQNLSLYKFIERNKRAHKDGTLSPERLQLLTEINALVYRSLASKRISNDSLKSEFWQRKYLELLDYKEKNGHCNVPQRGPNAKLGKWCCTQREDYRIGKMNSYRHDMLKNLGFDFDLLEKQWTDNFEIYKAYKGKAFDMSESLRGWVYFQRDRFKEGKLSEERIKLLTEVGFDFELGERFLFKKHPIDKHPQWAEIVAYYMANKTWSVPKSHKLCSITKHIREYYRKGILPDATIKILNKLKFVWDPEKRMTAQAYKENNRKTA